MSDTEEIIQYLRYASRMRPVVERIKQESSSIVKDSPGFQEIMTIAHELTRPWLILEPIHNAVGESKSCALFDYLIATEDMSLQALWHGIVENRREFVLPIGRVDRLLRHADGTYTMVEIKPPGSRRAHAQALGQTLMYAASFRNVLGDNTEVRCAIFVDAESDAEFENACRSVGVAYITMPNGAKKSIEALARAYCTGNV